MLEPLGLSELDELVYRHMLRQPGSHPADLSTSLGVGRRRMAASLGRLADAGLVHAGGADVSPTPVDPTVALNALVRRRQTELDSVAIGISDLAEDFRSGAMSEAPHRAVEVVIGRDRVVRRTSDLAVTVESEILVFDTPPYASDLSREVDRELTRLERGVVVKSLYSAAALALPERLSRVRQLVRHGEQARVLPTLPLKLHVYDRRTAVVPLVANSAAADSVALVHESGLLDLVIAMFETLWENAPRLDAPAEGRSGAASDAELLSLLNAGVKDEAIARQLGVSVRTARRRITGLISRLNSTSRFQAGVEASRRGWLP